MSENHIFSINNHRGSALMVVMVVVTLFGLAMLAMQRMADQVNSHTKQASNDENREQLKRELDILFSNRELCLASLVVSGSNFSFLEIIKPQTQFMPGIFIEDMHITDLRNYSNISKAQFNIKYSYTGPNGVKLAGYYERGVGFAFDESRHLVECNADLNREKACARVGALWVEEEQRCDICGLLGGTWQRRKCLI